MFCKKLKHTSKQHYERIKVLREFELIPHELNHLCVLYLGYRELVAKLTVHSVLEHTPLRFKKVKLVKSDFGWTTLGNPHDHTFHIDKECNQQTIHCLKILQKMIRKKLPYKTYTINLELQHRRMQETTFLNGKKSFPFFVPLKTAPYYEFQFKCYSTECERKCIKKDTDAKNQDCMIKNNVGHEHIECDICVALSIYPFSSYFRRNNLDRKIIGEVTSIVF